jgi:hypothetical protein
MFSQDFPQRHPNHVQEDESIAIFIRSLPRNWIVRKMPDDYGIDLQVEVVNPDGGVTGRVIPIQLKSARTITWTQTGTFTLYKISKQTTNLWVNSLQPVFVVLVDCETNNVYSLPVQDYVRRNYGAYRSGGEHFSYTFSQHQLLTAEKLLADFYYEQLFFERETQTIALPQLAEAFQRLYVSNYGRDFHMEVSDEAKREASNCYSAISRLCRAFFIRWDLPSIDEIVRHTPINGSSYMHEYHLTSLLESLDVKLCGAIQHAKKLVLETHREYWLQNHHDIFEYFEQRIEITFSEVRKKKLNLV